jgi:DNA-binding NarL/FixJ family response regulator
VSTDALNSLVTSAIWRAEQLEEHEISSAPLAWAEVAALEEKLATALPVSQPEGRIARRGAVRAALKARDYDRAQALAQRYLAEKDAPESLRSALCEIMEGEYVKRPRLLIADDHLIMLVGLKVLLEPDFEVAGTVMESGALLEAVERLQPDLVIADISIPGSLDGLEATRRLRVAHPGLPVLILGAQTEPSWAQAAIEAGAHGYLAKISGREEIQLAIREVLRGQFFVSQAVARGMAETVSNERLTLRELEIVRLVVKGVANEDIAHRLGISATTVRTYLGQIHKKLGTASRAELVRFAARATEP